MKSNLILVGVCVILLSVFQSCRQKTIGKRPERFTSDSATIVVDESFRPIVDEEFYIFRALYSNVHPRVLYTTENEMVNLLLTDSVAMAVISRELTAKELKSLTTRKLKPFVDRFAIDAVTLIVNSASADTTITVNEIKKLLNSHTKLDRSIVFDNPNSSLVRYLKEFCGSIDLKQKNIYALKSNKEVIRYVAGHPDAIGITGFSWLNDPDKDYAADVQKIKIVGVRDENSKDYPNQYFKPSQNTLALKQYPLTRNLYFLNFTGNFGLGMKFASFLASDRGQRIILKSGLLPNEIPTREVIISRKIKTKSN